MTQSLAVVAGAGSGLGVALMKRFNAGGYRTVGFTRSSASGDDGLDVRALDLTDSDAVKTVMLELIETYGPPKIVVHNTATLVIKSFDKTTLEDYEATWRSMTLSCAALGQATIMPMVRAGGGAFLVSGATASLRGGAKFSAFASAKFALRGMTQSLAREFQGAGVHVAHFILDGIIDSTKSRDLHGLDPSRMMKTDDLAEVYWQVAHQPKSTWTHEIDLRPSSESF